jgi:hypothetical protein
MNSQASEGGTLVKPPVWGRSAAARSANSVILAFWLGASLLACSRPPQARREPAPAERVWAKAEYDYRTNNLPKAYQLLKSARDELTRMWRSGQSGLNYPYCLAFLDGRLFIMARSLGDTNAADKFLKESAFYFNESGKEERLPPTNLSGESIEAIVRARDAKLREAETNSPPPK